MKKLLLFIAVMTGILFFSSCEKEPRDEAPFPVGTWRTTHQEFNLTVDAVFWPPTSLETIKEERERESSVSVTEAESYRLTFNEDGTGSGSIVHPVEGRRSPFVFTWVLSDNELSIRGTDVFLSCGIASSTTLSVEWGFVDSVIWEIEESSADEMVLVQTFSVSYEISEGGPSWKETQTYRYTFEKR